MLPLRYKLGIYFIAFSAIMLIFLWIFQTVFLETCYTFIKQHQVKTYASQIIESIESGENTTETINSLSRENEMSVFVYDSTDGLMTKKYSSEFNNPIGMREMTTQSVYNYYQLTKEAGGKYTATSVKNEDNVEITFNHKRGSTDDEKKPMIGSVENHHDKAENMVFAEIINLSNDTECFVLITALVTPVSSVISTLHMQLAIVSLVFLIFAIVLSVIVARRISKPLGEINSGVKELAKQNYNLEFNSSGYLEAKELSDTLNVTRKELQNVENLRQELIANISHDLRTPLTMITGYAEVMRDLPGENTPENVQVIIDEINRLTSLVNDMLDL
ncbi:MAG: HAMP domain-containing histidine kinase [Ruminococcus sp.]|nr:HAMP domain-containing histidine kinase [Ruminococcus sp.]